MNSEETTLRAVINELRAKLVKGSPPVDLKQSTDELRLLLHNDRAKLSQDEWARGCTAVYAWLRKPRGRVG